MMTIVWLLLLFAAAFAVGGKIIREIPSLLHTPLMSGMNALSGITLVGALLAVQAAVIWSSQLLAGLAIMLAAINVVGGFAITHRMLKMFKTDHGKEGQQ